MIQSFFIFNRLWLALALDRDLIRLEAFLFSSFFCLKVLVRWRCLCLVGKRTLHFAYHWKICCAQNWPSPFCLQQLFTSYLTLWVKNMFESIQTVLLFCFLWSSSGVNFINVFTYKFFVRTSFRQLFLVAFWLWQKIHTKNARIKCWRNWRQVIWGVFAWQGRVRRWSA